MGHRRPCACSREPARFDAGGERIAQQKMFGPPVRPAIAPEAINPARRPLAEKRRWA